MTTMTRTLLLCTALLPLAACQPTPLPAEGRDPGAAAQAAAEDCDSADFPACNDTFVNGDVNGDGEINMSDPTALLDYLFNGGGNACPEASDVNGDGAVNLSDATYLLDFLFQGGPPPVGYPYEETSCMADDPWTPSYVPDECRWSEDEALWTHLSPNQIEEASHWWIEIELSDTDGTGCGCSYAIDAEVEGELFEPDFDYWLETSHNGADWNTATGDSGAPGPVSITGTVECGDTLLVDLSTAEGTVIYQADYYCVPECADASYGYRFAGPRLAGTSWPEVIW